MLSFATVLSILKHLLAYDQLDSDYLSLGLFSGPK